MALHMHNGMRSVSSGTSLKDLPKAKTFTSNLPADQRFPTPRDSHLASRDLLGPRQVRNALYTFVRPEHVQEFELACVSQAAMRDIGIKDGDQETDDFKQAMAGNKLLAWNEETGEGIYPWAQCYGGWQFGSWASQLGDGRAISLFETINTESKARYEVQLKGAGKTPYSRFADGKAVVRSSIREFVVSEALNALNIPSTRALALTILPNANVQRERTEPGAIVTRFAHSWLRIGTFDLLRARGERQLLRQLAVYVAEYVFTGWESLPGRIEVEDIKETSREAIDPPRGVPQEAMQGPPEKIENRFARLYREIVRRNAKTVAAWQAYAFTNGVLNTDNTSILGLSLDFGPFAFLDNFDPNYTPNHDDFALRYSYKNQPTAIWWNLVRLGEDFGELLGAGDRCDDQEFVEKGVTEEYAPILLTRAESIIQRAGEEYKAVFLNEYKRIMASRLGLKSMKSEDFEDLLSDWLDTMEALELDFNQSFRKLSEINIKDVKDEEQRREVARVFFHHEGITGVGNTEDSAMQRVGSWLGKWMARVTEDWGEHADAARRREMKKVNPKFIPKSWVLNELIERVEKKGERAILNHVMDMALNPFEDDWGWNKAEEERYCGDVPKLERAIQCSCSS